MAPSASLALRAPLGASLRLVGGRKADRRTEVEDLRMEVRAAGQEMVATSHRILNALVIDDTHTAMHYASRLAVLGRTYSDPDAA